MNEDIHIPPQCEKPCKTRQARQIFWKGWYKIFHEIYKICCTCAKIIINHVQIRIKKKNLSNYYRERTFSFVVVMFSFLLLESSQKYTFISHCVVFDTTICTYSTRIHIESNQVEKINCPENAFSLSRVSFFLHTINN